MNEFLQVTKTLLEASKYTFGLFFATLIIAIPLGMVICAFAMSKFKPLKYVTNVFIWVIRGTPLMLQIIVVMYAPGLLFNMPVHERFLAALIAFVINYAVYFAEIYRGGIISMPIGQYEACKVLGMSKAQTNRLIILPQVAKKITPAMSNEVITLVKDTSLARVIGIAEIIMESEKIVATKGILWPLFYTGVFYLAMIGVLTLFFKWLEKKMNYYRA
ncbi:MAG: amino acid ABC transporter permease [Clostridia bacterium]|nr:amino acid ABC transporter permease [Clostridia bacterium]MDE6211777.1 amino acid ABC transporter permease [Clostridia bacterium]MDE6605777.1 amino acid ABC transporter permease [Clostridia bacterium]